MDIIKRKILLEDYISREDATWGVPKWDLDPTFTHFTMNVFITQDGDDMGIPTDVPFIEVVNPSFTDDTSQPNTRFPGKSEAQYFINGELVTGFTEDRLDEVVSYDASLKFKPLFDIRKSTVDDYQDNTYDSGTRVLENLNEMPITYGLDIDTNESIDVNNPNPDLGIVFKTYSGLSRTIQGTIFPDYEIPITEAYFNAQGMNSSNSQLSAITKEEYLFGITTTPEVFSDVFIDRGRTTVRQSHMQLSEIRNMSDLINYGNGFYNIQK